jgi:PAS domain S-box-containing protein
MSDEQLVIAAVRDRSDAVAAEAAQAELAAIVNSSVDGILTMTTEGTITSWNAGAEHALGYRPGEVRGRHISVLIPDESSTDFEALLDAAQTGDEVVPRDTEWRTRDGSLLPVAITVSPLRDPAGQVSGFSVLFRDIRERKQAELEMQALLQQLRRYASWQELTAEVRLAALSGQSVDALLDLMCHRLIDVLGARAAVAHVLDGDQRVTVGAGGPTQLHLLAEGLARVGPPPEGGDDALAGGRVARRLSLEHGLGLVLGARIVVDGEPVGVVLVQPRLAEPSATDTNGIRSLAELAALTLHLERARADRERLLVAEDRDRIARDLHDLVIQRVFAAGLQLQGVAQLTEDRRVIERIGATVDELDQTISELRTTIFTLASTTRDGAGLRARVLMLIAESSRVLGFEPMVRFDGPIDAAVDPRVADHSLAVVREALSNTARHANAESVTVELSAVAHELTVVVEDDGIGLSERSGGSGLANLRARAELVGGQLDLGPGRHGGTRLEWRVPLA